MIRIIRNLSKFGSVNKFTNWETDVINAKTPVIVDFHATYINISIMLDGVDHARD